MEISIKKYRKLLLAEAKKCDRDLTISELVKLVIEKYNITMITR
jgi:hypothetical protein